MRRGRKKSLEYKYHIRVRGTHGINLFNDDEDKEKYLFLLKKYAFIFKFKIYSYCFMDTHAHYFIDPLGTDISIIMHRINLSYAQYYNKKYKRYGHVFRDRFESNPVCNNSYSLALSIYIHNNPKDIIEYRGKEEYFYYSSYGIYCGIRKNEDSAVDIDYVLNLMLCKERKKAIKKYILLVKKQLFD
ncbi:MAG: transposase, partial [Clostridia bacterium]|nr:transposase [Clostridia bacterium]